ncbi:MAG TPA: sensor histidine kinase [Ktedonobacterales bacterium]|nr:sensor histidine kinase [Ktedonobacterales bacterium]
MRRLRRLSWGTRWALACGVALGGLLVTLLAEALLADNALAYSSDARNSFLVIGGLVSVALGVLVLAAGAGGPFVADGQVGARRWRFGSLFWRLALSYLVVSFMVALIAIYASRYEGPFGFLRHSALVDFFNRLYDNTTNGQILLVMGICLIGVLTGALLSRNLTRRLHTIAEAADAWSQGDFRAAARDPSGDELGRLARDLNRMAEQVRTLLATREELAVVEERNRLARELHDTVKQHVFANALLVRAARKQLDRDPETAKRHLCEAEELAEQTQQELIALIQALRPAALADKGLVAMLGDYAREWSERSGIAVDLRVQGERATPLDVEEALYRVVQEALANIARHSGAAHAEIGLAWDDERLRLTVSDDGRGFDVADAEGKGLGLASMRERVQALGGALSLSSGSGETRVEACVPLAVARLPEALVEVAHE